MRGPPTHLSLKKLTGEQNTAEDESAVDTLLVPRRKYQGAYQALSSQLDPTRPTLQDLMPDPFFRSQYRPFGDVHVGWNRLEDAVDGQATDKACQGRMSAKMARIRLMFGVCSTPEGQLGVDLEEGINKAKK